MHLLIEVREIVFSCPGCDFIVRAIRPALAVRIASISLLQKALVVALQLAIELDANDASAAVVQSVYLGQICPIDFHVM